MNDIFILHDRNYQYFSLVDIEDREKVLAHKWNYDKTKKDFAFVELGKKTYLHELLSGEKFIDHINRVRFDNRKRNFRKTNGNATIMGANSDKRKSNKTGYKGVCWDKLRQKFKAQLMLHRTQLFLGRFDDPIDAAKAYDAAAKKYFGEYAVLNFP